MPFTIRHWANIGTVQWFLDDFSGGRKFVFSTSWSMILQSLGPSYHWPIRFTFSLCETSDDGDDH